jgi:type IV pilus assembly protein PilW
MIQRPRGFTLTEVMVAVTIGLLLTALVTQLFAGSRRTYATADDVARMQESIRAALDVIGRTVRSIGYMSAPNTYSVPTDGYPGVFDVIPAIQGTDGSRNAPDTFAASFEGSGTLRGTSDGVLVDCLGNATTAGVISTSTFTIQNDVLSNAPGLFCNGTLIAPYVENMQVLYGEDTNGDANTDHFLPAGSVTPNNIVSMRLALLFRTPNANVRPNPDGATYDLNGVVVGPFNDTYMRRVVTTTITLRNRTP